MVAKTHMMLYLYRSFPQKSPIFSGSFAEISSVGVLKSHELCHDLKGGEDPYDVLSLWVIFLKRAL